MVHISFLVYKVLIMFLLEVHLNHFFKPNMQEALVLQEKLINDVSLYSKPFYPESVPESVRRIESDKESILQGVQIFKNNDIFFMFDQEWMYWNDKENYFLVATRNNYYDLFNELGISIGTVWFNRVLRDSNKETTEVLTKVCKVIKGITQEPPVLVFGSMMFFEGFVDTINDVDLLISPQAMKALENQGFGTFVWKESEKIKSWYLKTSFEGVDIPVELLSELSICDVHQESGWFAILGGQTATEDFQVLDMESQLLLYKALNREKDFTNIRALENSIATKKLNTIFESRVCN